MNRQKNNSVGRRIIFRRNTQSSASTYVGETLPNDLIIEILLRLPTKPINKFRTVSKLWASLIRRRDFTEMFLKSSLSRPRFLFTFIIGSKCYFFSSPQPQNFDEKSIVATEYNPFIVGSKQICQSVHGFIYLKHTDRFEEKIVHKIYNPCTGQQIYLPQVKAKNSFISSFLGYDPIGKQFKVLCIVLRKRKTSEHYQVLILGIGELWWRKIRCSFLHYPKKENNKGICINGVLYYIASINNSYSMIVCFDVRSEKFSFIEIENARLLSLINYKGKLGVVLCFDFGTFAELWVLDDAKKVKWSKHIFLLPNPARKPIKSIWATETGEIAWTSNPKTHPLYVFYYNLEMQRVRRVEIKGIEDNDVLIMRRDHQESFFAFTNYVENLMFL